MNKNTAILFFLLLSLFSPIAIAKSVDNTIRFQTYILDQKNNNKNSDMMYRCSQRAFSMSGNLSKASFKMVDMNIDLLTKFIKKLRASMCKILENGSMRVWISASGEAGIIISATAETGMEIIINCDRR